MGDNLIIAIKAAFEAGNAILEIYKNEFDVEFKTDESPITKADLKANTIINHYLESTNIPIISEENKLLPYERRKDWKICWIVDPLDGTKEFIKRNDEFTVNIALVINGNPILGVIYVPVQKTLYFTSKDASKAFKIILSDKNASLDTIFEDALEITPFSSSLQGNSIIKILISRSHVNAETQNYISEIKKNNLIDIVSVGSSLKFCLLAEGKANMYPRFSPTMEWDTAAGQAICASVGLEVIDLKSRKLLGYNKKNLLNGSFLVGDLALLNSN